LRDRKGATEGRGGTRRGMRRDTSAARYREGFVFLSLEDETGIVNVIVNPAIFHRNKGICVSAPYLLIKGVLQNTWGVVSVEAAQIEVLPAAAPAMTSHDFH
jgi:error-prone DNA polymerase